MPATHARDSATRQLTVPCPSCHRWNRIDASRVADRPKCGACAAPLGLDRPLSLDDATFDRVIGESDLPVLVDFYADWCGPCRMMAPAVDELARSVRGQALVAKLDTEAASDTARRFQILGIPTVVLFRAGREAERTSGVMSLAGLRQMIG